MGQIRVSGLGKAYKQYPNRWSRLFEWLVPFSPPRHHLHWILREVEFTIEPGEAVGIVGINGAGKSTLLKMIAGTTQPTCGEIRVAGRVAALLELGMGFHPDFTGRQNVFMAGQLLGMQVEEIQALMLRSRPSPKSARPSSNRCAPTPAACRCAWRSAWRLPGGRTS